MRHPLLSLILLSLPSCVSREEGEACMPVEDGQDTCPDPSEVDLDQIHEPFDCDDEVVRMLSEEAPEIESSVFQDGSSGCCYEVILADRTPNSECIVGRPFMPDGARLGAALEGPAEAELPAAARAWAEIGRAEHASVAAFARLQLQLMVHGAPLDLLGEVARALSDEVRHARLAFGVASDLAGGPVGPGAFPLPGSLEVAVPLARLAAEAVREGCVGETLSALATRRAAQEARDPALRALLARLASDEERHAVLSWRVVAWAVQRGGAEVRQAVVDALREPVRFGGPVESEELADQGILGPRAMRRVAEEGLRRVVAPAATALLAA